MKTKENKKKKNSLKFDKKKIVIAGSIAAGFIVILGIGLVLAKVWNTEVYAASKEMVNETVEAKAGITIDLNETIAENAKPLREEIVTEEIDLEYTTIYQNNNDLAKGSIQVLQEGRDGKQTVINKKVYQEDTLLREEQSGNVVTKASINKMVEVGTGSYTNNYKLKKGDKVYVTSYTLNMMLEPNKEATKVTTLAKGVQATFLQAKDGWYQITAGSYTGWVDGECLTHQNKEEEKQAEQKGAQQTQTGKSKSELLATLKKDMALNKPSGLTLDQFKKVLSGCKEDSNKTLEQNAEYFYYIEKQYHINGIFVAAVGIHESAWGTSQIARDKKNLFGYGANDGDAYNKAYRFGSYAEGIDLVSRVFVKYYLNPAGTKIYDNETASGKYYSGNTLTAVNKRYATDKNWNEGVYKWMTYLYNRI